MLFDIVITCSRNPWTFNTMDENFCWDLPAKIKLQLRKRARYSNWSTPLDLLLLLMQTINSAVDVVFCVWRKHSNMSYAHSRAPQIEKEWVMNLLAYRVNAPYALGYQNIHFSSVIQIRNVRNGEYVYSDFRNFGRYLIDSRQHSIPNVHMAKFCTNPLVLADDVSDRLLVLSR